MFTYGKKLLACLFAGVLLSYVITVFFTGGTAADIKNEKGEENLHVLAGETSLDLSEEEYLLGRLVVSVPAEYELETIKAMTVILRTDLYRRLEQGNVIVLAEGDYADAFSRERALGPTRFIAWQKKAGEAVAGTKDLVLRWDGELIDAAFHQVSAGKTRAGSCPWLPAVESSQDRSCGEYMTLQRFSAKELADRFPEISPALWRQAVFVTEGDSSYIKEVDVGKQAISGETFRSALSLCSSAFYGAWEGDGLQILCKGRGHGFGFSCYGANQLALKGADFQTLLKTYYGNITLSGE